MDGWIPVGRKAAGEQDQRPGGGSEKGAEGSSDAWLIGGRRRRGCWAFGRGADIQSLSETSDWYRGPTVPLPLCDHQGKASKSRWWQPLGLKNLDGEGE